MLSGNGRHRRPRQAPALLVAAGVTGSAIAIPLLGATGASAAGGNTWDQVAECESGGSWSEDSGNGYYGGLQVSQEDWEEYGGLEYASSADQASRSQQIAVAEKMLDDKGIAAWPTCGLLAGLSEDSGSAGVDTGTADDASSDSSESSGSSGSSEYPGLSDSSESSSSSASPSPSDKSSKENSDAKGDSGNSGASSESDSDSSAGAEDSQESDSASTGATKTDESDNFGQSEGFSSLVDTGALGTGRHRGDTADESGSASSSGRHAARADSAAGDAYTVRFGDTLASIADSLDVQGGWRALYALNKQEIGSDPSSIVPGQTLVLDAE